MATVGSYEGKATPGVILIKFLCFPLVEILDESWVDVDPVYPCGISAGVGEFYPSMFGEELSHINPTFCLDFLDCWGFGRISVEVPSQERWSVRMFPFLARVPGLQNLFGE